MFDLDIFETQDFALTQPNGIFAREPRNATCLGTCSSAAALACGDDTFHGLEASCDTDAGCAYTAPTGCMAPNYEIPFQTSFSLAPHCLGTACSLLAVLAMLIFVPLNKKVEEKADEGEPAAP
jgi:hypothetical protein